MAGVGHEGCFGGAQMAFRPSFLLPLVALVPFAPARAQDPCRCGFYSMLDEVQFIDVGCDDGEVRPSHTSGSYCCEDGRRTGGSTVLDVGECGAGSELGKITRWSCNFRAS